MINMKKNTFGGKGVPEHMENLSWNQFVKSIKKSIHRNIGTGLLLITCYNLNGSFQHVVSFIIFLLEHIEATIDSGRLAWPTLLIIDVTDLKATAMLFILSLPITILGPI